MAIEIILAAMLATAFVGVMILFHGPEKSPTRLQRTGRRIRWDRPASR